MTSTTINNMQDSVAPGDLHSRVSYVERDLGRLDANMKDGFAAIRKDGDDRHNDLTGMIRDLTKSQADRSRTPWTLILGGLGTTITVLSVAGTLLYTPLRERLGEIAERQQAMQEKSVTEKELATVIGATSARRDDAQRTLDPASVATRSTSTGSSPRSSPAASTRPIGLTSATGTG